MKRKNFFEKEEMKKMMISSQEANKVVGGNDQQFDNPQVEITIKINF